MTDPNENPVADAPDSELAEAEKNKAHADLQKVEADAKQLLADAHTLGKDLLNKAHDEAMKLLHAAQDEAEKLIVEFHLKKKQEAQPAPQAPVPGQSEK